MVFMQFYFWKHKLAYGACSVYTQVIFDYWQRPIGRGLLELHVVHSNTKIQKKCHNVMPMQFYFRKAKATVLVARTNKYNNISILISET